MRVHYLQHVRFEGIAAIADWVQDRGHSLSGTELFRTAPGADGGAAAGPTGTQRGAAAGPAAAPAPWSAPEGRAGAQDFPSPVDLDLLVVMGGPMNIYQHEAHPWLVSEKVFIRAAIEAGKAVLGICLGAQLVADVLGGPVTRGEQVEIGWYPVRLTPAAGSVPVFIDFPADFTAFHWHGDTFAIPPGAVHVASSAACANQAFAYDGGRVAGLQFHLEPDPPLVAALLENAGGEVDRYRGQPWVQSREELRAPSAPYKACQALLFALLDRMLETIG